MKVYTRRDASWLYVRAELEDGDTPVKAPGSLAAADTRVHLAGDAEVHPDLIALAAILIFEPWTRRFEFSFGVSEEFAAAARQHAGIEVVPVDSELSPRVRPDESVPGLCYSGGADCTAALTVMPGNTVSYFLDRIPRSGEAWRGLYRKDAAFHACDSLRASGRIVHMVETDLEFVRSPVGFPHDFSNAVPLVLAADRDRLGSVAWGAILESTYRVGSLRFRDYERSPWFVGVGPLFEAVGLPIYNPVAGVSEVGTAMISTASPYGSFAQSCMRGDVGQPCRRCWKCARKILLDSALSGVWPSPAEIDAMVVGADTPKLFLKEPLKHECVVAFLASRYPDDGGSEFMRLLRKRVAGYDTNWLKRWYQPSLALCPADLQDVTASRLNDYLSPMSTEDERAMTSWNLTPLLEKLDRKVATEEFSTYLRSLTEKSRDSARVGGNKATREPR